jgi:parallel beta-helix repeat protein
LANLVKAQSEYPNLVETRRAFQPILDYNIPTGILKDVNIGNGVLERHQGFETDSMNDPIEFLDIVQNLKNSASNYNILPSKETILSTIAEFKKAGFVPISLIHHTYARIEDSAYINEVIEHDSNTNVFSFRVNPSNYFNIDTVKAFAVHGNVENALTVRFVFPSNLILSNGPLPEIYADFGDQNGFILIEPNKPYTVTYPDYEGPFKHNLVRIKWQDKLSPEGFKPITPGGFNLFKVTPPDYQTLVSNLVLTNVCTGPETTDFGDARFSIRHGKAQSVSKQLKKPFILIEGFDVDLNPNDNKFGTVDWNTFSSGISFDERNNPTRENLKDLKILAERLYNEDYDCIFVDFKNGAGDLYKNSNALIRIIQWVNQNKQSDEELVVMGASMGGLIARYALRTMEIEGCNPCVKLYGTFDSPHQGANLPLSIQHAIKGMAHLSTDADLAYKLLFTKGAQQMLVDNVTDPNKVIRNKWQNTLNEMGHPQSPKRIAITNGSPEGNRNEIKNPGDLMYDFRINLEVKGKLLGVTLKHWKFEPLIYSGLFAKSRNKINPVYSYLTIRKTALDSLRSANSKIAEATLNVLYNDIIANGVNHIWHDEGLTLDNAAGGQADWLKILHSAINNVSVEVKKTKDNTEVKVEKLVTNHTGKDFFTTFVPTFSGLDMKQTELYPNLNEMFPVVELKPTSLLPNQNIHPFHAVHFHSDADKPTINQEHVLVDGRNGQNIDFIISQLKSVDNNLPSIIPSQIPNQNVFNYNHIIDFHNRIKNVTITNGGILKLNNEGYGGFGDKPKPVKTDNSFDYSISSCANGITIENGGQMIVGDNNNELGKNNRARLFVTPGSFIEIKDNGKMTIQRGSKVVIEPGATLVFHDQARIELFGEASALEIQGRILVQDGATFKLIESTDDLMGKLILKNTTKNKGESLVAEGSNCKIQLAGSKSYEGEQLKVQNGPWVLKGFQQVDIEKMEIQTEALSPIEAHTPLKVQFVRFKAAGNQKAKTVAIKTFGQKDQFIERNLFSGLETAVHLNENSQKAEVKLGYNQFDQCATALIVQDCKPMIQNNQFKSCNEGIYLISSDNASIHANRFVENVAGIYSEQTQSNPGLYFTDNLFLNNQFGMKYHNKGNVTLKCNRFYSNQKAIYSDGNVFMSATDMTSNLTGGLNTFLHNTTGIELDGGALFLENGDNNFIGKSGNSHHHFIQGNVDYNSSCLNTSLQLRAADNYWYPAPNGNDLTNGSGSHYQTTTLTFSNPTVVKLKGNINTNPDLTCYNPTDEDIPSQNSQTKNADSEIASQNGLFYPNPWVSGPLKIQLNLDIETNIVISMTNINGVEVFRHAVNHQPSGQFYSEIPEWNGITSGLYILTVTTNQKSFKEKIVK